jgi:Holliday junction DNA helicase RuvB
VAIERSKKTAEIVNSEVRPVLADPILEVSLRPQNLDEYIGQQQLKDNLKLLIEASKLRKEALDHILFHGPPGLGKTTLANIIGKELKVGVRVTSGPALEKPGDLASIITNLKENDLLFIDEIHRLKPAVEEILYTAMEDYGIDIVLGKGPGAKAMRLKLPKFSLVGATTKMSMLSSPLRDRFGALFKLEFYELADLKKIIERSAKILSCEITEEAATKLAKSARNTPRIANRLLKRVRDFAQVGGSNIIDISITITCLKALGIDDLGLDSQDRAVLNAIIDKFKGGPVGLGTLAAAISEDENTIEDVYEPFLMQLGFLERTSRGRAVTERAYGHLGLNKIN